MPPRRHCLPEWGAGTSRTARGWVPTRSAAPCRGLKTMNHPTLGVLHFEHTSVQANDDPALKLVIYTPV
ncbi:hypothetical protein QA649_22235 [Bradyrhizobium sp. CB1717]|nr:hypothetical protein [Bradyrhizobium sp. CB1717]WFU20846.1 hypothetical protein QA649_22235 [Bradyrhizobium sp. CB1717]